MPRYNDLYNPTNNERHEFVLFHIEKNSWDYNKSEIVFYGRPATSVEKKLYTVQKGVVNHNEGTYIYASNLPDEIEPNDQIKYLGKIWLVESVGYYLDKATFIDASIFDDEFIKAKSAKGITLR